ncbi:hypothetical protein ES703_01232 [subsurface metagenome]
MATIMSWGNSSGTRGRCDARCHNAKHPKCVCMCGGRFHGSANQPGGVEQTVRDYWDDVVDEAEKKAREEGLELETERWTKNRQRILGELPKLNKSKKQQQAIQYRLPLEVANVR